VSAPAESAVSREHPGPGHCDLLVTKGYVMTMDPERTIYPEGAVAITDGRIVAVGPARTIGAQYSATRTIDAKGAPVHPGLVESHVHLLHTARGAFSAVAPRTDGSAVYAHWWNSQTEQEDYAGTVLACVEMARNGVTSFMEAGSAMHPDATAAAVEAVGIRASLPDAFLWDRGYGVSAKVPLTRAPVSLERSLRDLGGQLWRNKASDALVRGHVALYGSGTASIELLRAAKACADEAGVIFNQHQSFQASAVEAEVADYGMPPLLYFQAHGILGQNCSFTHMNFLTDEEIEAVQDSRMSVIWCVTSSMVWGVGGTSQGKHAELYKAGVPIGLGADAPNSACRFDPGVQSLCAVLTARDKTLDRSALGPEDALEMMTISGAHAIGMDGEVGSLEIGKRGDVVIRTENLPEARGVDPLQTIVFSAGGRSVDTVLVGGVPVVEKGHATRVDEEATYAQAADAGKQMLRRIGMTQVSQRWPEVR
jgi:5-methylthioadenosine/S-adenosylhomocysteine deaminase